MLHETFFGRFTEFMIMAFLWTWNCNMENDCWTWKCARPNSKPKPSHQQKKADTQTNGKLWMHLPEMWYGFIIIIIASLVRSSRKMFSPGARSLWLFCLSFFAILFSLGRIGWRVCVLPFITLLFSYLHFVVFFFYLNWYFRWFFHVCYVFVRTDLLSDFRKVHA